MPTVEFLNYEVLDDNEIEMDDEDIFTKAADADLDSDDHGTLEVKTGEYILDAAESNGYDWPFSCRFGSCANCAAKVVEGEVEMDMQQILSEAEISEQSIRLTCVGSPVTDVVKIIYNVKHSGQVQSRVI